MRSAICRSTGFLIAFAVASLLWSPIEPIDKWAMFYSLIVLSAVLVCAYSLIENLTYQQLIAFNKHLAFALAAAAAIYTLESVFSLGLRSPEGVVIDPYFGIDRVKGPIFAASTGYFAIMPALGLLVTDSFSKKGGRIVGLAAISALVVALVGTGSRGGMIVFCAFILFIVCLVKGTLKRIFIVFLSVVIICGAIYFVFQEANATRFNDLYDVKRQNFYSEAALIIASRSGFYDILGSGYGSHWPWYRLDEFVRAQRFSWSVSTADGQLTADSESYHPHSLPIVLCVELGLVGLAYLVFLVSAMLRIGKTLVAKRHLTIWAIGMVVTCIAFWFDLFLLYHPIVFETWWISLLSLEKLANGVGP